MQTLNTHLSPLFTNNQPADIMGFQETLPPALVLLDPLQATKTVEKKPVRLCGQKRTFKTLLSD